MALFWEEKDKQDGGKKNKEKISIHIEKMRTKIIYKSSIKRKKIQNSSYCMNIRLMGWVNGNEVFSDFWHKRNKSSFYGSWFWTVCFAWVLCLYVWVWCYMLNALVQYAMANICDGYTYHVRVVNNQDIFNIRIISIQVSPFSKCDNAIFTSSLALTTPQKFTFYSFWFKVDFGCFMSKCVHIMWKTLEGIHA